MKSKVKSRRSPRVAHAREVHINGVNGVDSLQRKAEFYDQLALACDLQVGHVVRGLGHNLLPTTLKETQEYLKLHPSTIRGSGGIESPEEILDSLRPGSLEDIFRSGSLELPEKAVDELVELMRSRPRSLDTMLEKPSKPSQPLKESPEEAVERLRKAWPLTIEDAGLEQLGRPGMTIQVGGLGAVQLLESESRTSKSPPSTQEIIDKFLASKRAANLSSETIQSYSNTLRPFVRHFPILPDKPETIEEYLAPYRGENSTAWNIFTRIRILYDFAESRGFLSFPNPMRAIQTPRKVRKPPEHLDFDQAARLITAIGDDRERGLVYCMFGLGLRLKETRRLAVMDIGEDTVRTIHGKERDEPAPLAPPIREVLLRLAEGKRPDELIFQGRQGALSDSLIQSIVKKLFIRAGITGVRPSPHTLRHSKGALSSMLGLDTYSNRRLMRHTSTQMTDRYIELNMEELKVKDRQYNPLLQLLGKSELGKKPDYTQLKADSVLSDDPAQLVPQLLDWMIALGQIAQELKHSLGGNGHRAEQIEEIKQYLKCQASK